MSGSQAEAASSRQYAQTRAVLHRYGLQFFQACPPAKSDQRTKIERGRHGVSLPGLQERRDSTYPISIHGARKIFSAGEFVMAVYFHFDSLPSDLLLDFSDVLQVSGVQQWEGRIIYGGKGSCVCVCAAFLPLRSTCMLLGGLI